MPPELIKDSKSNQFSFKIDVYSYGIVLFMLITKSNPFSGLSDKKILMNTVNGKRPEFPSKVDKEWENLIIKCWNQDPYQRPDFTDICNTIEKSFINDSIDVKSFNKYKKIINRCQITK